MELNKIYNMDCLDGLKELPDQSVNLIVTDPPYFNVMKKTWDGVDVDWDKQWVTMDDYRAWLKKIMLEFNRVLKDNGSIYVFTDNINGAYVQVDMAEIFTILNRIEWVKTNGLNSKYWQQWRRFTSCNESIIFAEKKTNDTIRDGADLFKSVKDYMRSERDRLMTDKGMKTFAEFDRFIDMTTDTRSVVSRHYFADSQYMFPTHELYTKMQGTGYWSREYEELRREYEELRREYEELRRVFNPARNYTNIWTTLLTTHMDGGTIHPTQKPIKILKRIIETSSKEGDIVLDAFMGSGSTAVACAQTGRNFIGFEIDEGYYKLATNRVEQAIRDSVNAKKNRTLNDWITE